MCVVTNNVTFMNNSKINQNESIPSQTGANCLCLICGSVVHQTQKQINTQKHSFRHTLSIFLCSYITTLMLYDTLCMHFC
ncbi:hypothetical protein BCV71DRAFT_104049 [Rhizopus microsporus]|uniref:Uncharacterized protein n=1 Tax=Rhizopus microsporus TaxID=58291 RepID=A0A1X0S4Q4_RHIZD|nr:hypothetical protein BCV71DRAFT_104049 [Rhizopus microsporus]